MLGRQAGAGRAAAECRVATRCLTRGFLTGLALVGGEGIIVPVSTTVKLACRGDKHQPRGQRIVARFRWIASTGATGWHRLDGSAHLRVEDITGAMLWGESSAADGRHDVMCKGCGNKLDRQGSKLVPRLDWARDHGEKIVFLDDLN